MTRYQIVYYDMHGNADYHTLDGLNGDATDAALSLFESVNIVPGDGGNFMRPVITYPAIYLQ